VCPRCGVRHAAVPGNRAGRPARHDGHEDRCHAGRAGRAAPSARAHRPDAGTPAAPAAHSAVAPRPTSGRLGVAPDGSSQRSRAGHPVGVQCRIAGFLGVCPERWGPLVRDLHGSVTPSSLCPTGVRLALQPARSRVRT